MSFRPCRCGQDESAAALCMATFVLVDDTDSLPVENPGSCFLRER